MLGQFVESGIRAAVTGSPENGLGIGGWFLTGWGLLQAGWLWYGDRRSRALFWYIAAAVLDLLVEFSSWLTRVHHLRFGPIVSVVLIIASATAAIVGIFAFRRDLKRYVWDTQHVALDLRWWMCLLFSDLYFQYQFHLAAKYQGWEEERLPEAT